MSQHLPFNRIGVPFIELQSVDSSNNYAHGKIRDGSAKHGMAFFAHEQVTGKGQRGKMWLSEKGENIILSITIKPRFLSVANQFQLSAMVAVVIHEFFNQYAGNDTKIKWPNDLYWMGKKAGGILIENIIGGKRLETGNQTTASPNWEWAIIGIGININQTFFPTELTNPISLKQITRKNFEPVSLAKELCKKMDSYYQQLVNGEFESIYARYLSHLYKKNETVKLKKENCIFDAVIKTVSPTGQLVVRHAIEEQFNFNEVQWL